ncbi:meiotically up-regulated gene 113-domain-containing protein [Hyaloscypha finlandica]|nr:meiotically up-regulated gene 113-domain-containing protein [Hyaloscypha finlandica]
MPYIPHTPESLLPRSDSKNPTATCRGLTSNGRPCRRAISKSPQPSPSPSPRRTSSAPSTPNPEAFCWQHKVQADVHVTVLPQGLQSATIRERTSIDTLVDRLGLLEVEQKKERRQHRKPVPVKDPEKHSQRVDHVTQRPQRPGPRSKPQSDLGLFCCIGVADESKRAPRPVNHKPSRRMTATIPTQQRSKLPTAVQQKLSSQRPSIARDPSSRTGEFLSLIPTSASPQVTASLLAELAKPVSDADDEGYIYMFWLTPESVPAPPPSETASSLLAPPSRPIPGQRRTSDVLSTFASTAPNAQDKKTILLKIGRAQNVQRRLNQWTRQCGYNLSLIRYYPYHPTTLSDTSVNEIPRTPRKVPNAHKVERLIHIELNAKRAQGSGKCNVCGREHREWFEVDASKDGVKAVDEVVRRWVNWGERDAGR